MIVLVIMRMKLHEHVYHATWLPRETELFESPDLTPFLFVGLDQERNLQSRVDTRNELLPRILVAAASIDKA